MKRRPELGRARWRRLRRRVFDRARWRCEACGERGRLECDHIDRGGGDEMENLQALCRSCHIEKTANENRRDDPEGAAMRRLLEGLFD